MNKRMRLAARRGATLVLVAIMLLVIGGMAAFAIELAGVYGGVNQLQTGADAAALAGALRLQRTPGVSVASQTSTWATNNTAFVRAVRVLPSEVLGGFWDPAASTFTAGSWTTANAVRVTARDTLVLPFGAIAGTSSVAPWRSGVAWIANQATRDCIKPFGMSTTFINGLLGTSITSQAGVEALRTAVSTLAGQQSMTIIAGPLGSTVTGNPPTSNFLAITDPVSSSRRAYQNAIIGQNCEGTSDYDLTSAGTNIQPGGGAGDVPQTTRNSVELDLNGQQGNGGVATCAPQVGNDATCFDPATNTAGVTITVAAVTQSSVNTATINTFLSFRLMCVFRGARNGGGNGNGNGNGNTGYVNGSASTSESCPWLAAYRAPANNFMQGTLVGFPMPSAAVTGPGNTLGNTISTAQKLVLVR